MQNTCNLSKNICTLKGKKNPQNESKQINTLKLQINKVNTLTTSVTIYLHIVLFVIGFSGDVRYTLHLHYNYVCSIAYEPCFQLCEHRFISVFTEELVMLLQISFK